MDLEPEADGREVDVQASLTDLPFLDSSFGLIICFHVLEHIPDDAAAMRELARVLAPGGIVVAQVPYRRDAPTDEDPSAPPEERTRRFGQEDHVRQYGHDFEARLADAGLAGSRIEARHLVGESGAYYFGIQPGAVMWLLHVATAAHADGVTPINAYPQRTLIDLQSTISQLTTRTDQLEAELARTRREVSRYRSAYERVRFHPLVRAGAATVRPVRRSVRWIRQRRIR